MQKYASIRRMGMEMSIVYNNKNTIVAGQLARRITMKRTKKITTKMTGLLLVSLMAVLPAIPVSAEDMPSQEENSIYKPVIDSYLDFLHGGEFNVSEYYGNNDIMGEVQSARDAGHIDNCVYYIFEDFDEDGTDEMVIGFNDSQYNPNPSSGTEDIPFFYSFLWKIINGKPTIVEYKNMFRGSYLIRKGGVIIDRYGSGGDGMYTIDVWDPTHTVNIESLDGSWDMFEFVEAEVERRYPAYIFTGELHMAQ